MPAQPWWVFLAWTVLAGLAFRVMTRNFFGERVGADFGYFLPWLLSGYFWFLHNGLSIPWFTPALCAGIPHFANPQSLYYSVPQLLTFVTDPMTGIAMTTWLFAFIGFSGMWLLASLYTRTASICLFAALAFTFNDMFLWRTYVGHLTFQPFMLLPLVCYLLLREEQPAKRWLDAILAGALLAYFIHAGAGVLVVPVGACLLLVLLALGRGTELWLRLGVALLSGSLLAFVKLVAVAYFMAQFPRTLYPLPGTDGILASIELTVRALVLPPDASTIDRLVVHHAFLIEPVELNYAVGVVPVFVLLLCGLLSVGNVSRLRPTWKWFPIAVLLCLPIALDIYQPTWHAVLKALPYFGNVSSLFRWNLIYLLPAILLCVRLLDAVRGGANRFAPIAAIAVIPGAFTYAPHYLQPYDPSSIVASWHLADAGAPVPPVRELDEALLNGKRASTVGSDDALTHGASQIVCNEPLFGYRLENFRFDAVFRGPVLGERDGRFNFYMPQCFLFPDANRCEKGDRFEIDRASQLVRLTEYESIDFAMPRLQQIAMRVSYLAFVLLVGVAIARVWLVARLKFQSRVGLR